VEKNVKFLSNQQKASQLDVKTVSERIDPKEALVEEIETLIEDQEKCIRLLVQIVEKHVRFPLNLQKENQLDAKTVLKAQKLFNS